MDLRQKVWLFIIFGIVSLTILQASIVLFNPLYSDSLNARATQGSFGVCLNHEPVFLSFPCNTTIRQSRLFSCRLNISDFDSDSLSFEVSNMSGSTLQMNVSSEGVVSSFPLNKDVGLNRMRFVASDDSGCENNVSIQEIDFNVVNINDPPEFIPPMGPFSWSLDGTYRGVFLNTYFIDPDADAMTFSHSDVPDGFHLSVTKIGELIFSASKCGESSMIFTATDSHNASTSSTPVLLSVPCPQEESQTEPSSSSSFGSCISSWECSDWLDCLENGTQEKICSDIAGCEDGDMLFWRNCTYLPQCKNGIKDSGEEGVDCGGPCPVCPTCFDGVRNQGELGVDCGGPCAAVCSSVEVPKPVKSSNKPIFILMGFVIVISFLFIVYRLFFEQIHKFFARLLLLFIKKHNKLILLTNDQRDFLLNSISDLESKDLLFQSDLNKLSEFQDELSFILRNLFVFILSDSFDENNISLLIEKLKIPSLLKTIFKKYYFELLILERSDTLSIGELKLHLEVLRLRIFSLSNVNRSLISHAIIESPENNSNRYLLLLSLIHNLYLALQFGKVSLAKKKYLFALGVYAHLPVPIQSKVFNILHLSFDDIRYISSFKK